MNSSNFRRARKPMEPARALLKLEELCSRSEQCTADLMEKLHRWGISPNDAETVLRSLLRRRYVDDGRFARAFVQDRYRFAHWGRRKIGISLRQKRIDPDTIEDALEEIDQKEYDDILQHLIDVKARSIEQPKTYEGRMKIFRFCIQRGYEIDEVKKALSNFMK